VPCKVKVASDKDWYRGDVFVWVSGDEGSQYLRWQPGSTKPQPVNLGQSESGKNVLMHYPDSQAMPLFIIQDIIVGAPAKYGDVWCNMICDLRLLVCIDGLLFRSVSMSTVDPHVCLSFRCRGCDCDDGGHSAVPSLSLRSRFSSSFFGRKAVRAMLEATCFTVSVNADTDNMDFQVCEQQNTRSPDEVVSRDMFVEALRSVLGNQVRHTQHGLTPSMSVLSAKSLNVRVAPLGGAVVAGVWASSICPWFLCVLCPSRCVGAPGASTVPPLLPLCPRSLRACCRPCPWVSSV